MVVMIVDKDADTAGLLSLLLVEAGHSASIFADTSEAIVAACSAAPDLILLDLHVPGLPLEQFVKAIRNHCPACEIILMSGQHTVAWSAASLGVKRTITKPFDPMQVVALLGETKGTVKKPAQSL